MSDYLFGPVGNSEMNYSHWQGSFGEWQPAPRKMTCSICGQEVTKQYYISRIPGGLCEFCHDIEIFNYLQKIQKDENT